MTTALEKELAALVRTAPVIRPTSTCRETLRVLFQHPESKGIVVCNPSNEPLGLVMSERFFLIASGRDGVDLFYKEPIVNYMNRTPLTADISTSLESLRNEVINRPEMVRNECLIVTQNGKFIGVVYASELLL